MTAKVIRMGDWRRVWHAASCDCLACGLTWQVPVKVEALSQSLACPRCHRPEGLVVHYVETPTTKAEALALLADLPR